MKSLNGIITDKFNVLLVKNKDKYDKIFWTGIDITLHQHIDIHKPYSEYFVEYLKNKYDITIEDNWQFSYVDDDMSNFAEEIYCWNLTLTSEQFKEITEKICLLDTNTQVFHYEQLPKNDCLTVTQDYVQNLCYIPDQF